MLNFVKKIIYNKKLDRKIKCIEKFMTNSRTKSFKPISDKLEKDIDRRLKEKIINNEIPFEKYSIIMNGIYYHRNVNKRFKGEI